MLARSIGGAWIASIAKGGGRLRSLLRFGDHGVLPPPKLENVARLAGVGNATVFRALNGGRNVSAPVIERILDAIQKLDYRSNRVAQSLKGALSGVFGMIVPSIADDFFSHCAEAVEAVVRERGALLVVAYSRDDDDGIALDSVRQLLLHNIDGLIVAGSKPPSRKLVQLERGVRLPVVGIDGPLTGVGSKVPCRVCSQCARFGSGTG